MVRRFFLVLAVIGTALFGLTAVAAAAPALPKPTAVSFVLQSNPLKWATGTEAYGTVVDGATQHGLAGRKVYVFTKAHTSSSWKQTAIETSNSAGKFQLGLRPAVNTDIKMTVSAAGGYGAATSAQQTLNVLAPLVSSRIEPAGSGHEGDARQYLASTATALAGKSVVIQTNLNGGWSTIAVTTIGSNGSIAIGFHLRGGYRLYRLVLQSNSVLSGWVPGNNSILGVVVHPTYPTVIGPDSYGPFTMGMTEAQAKAVDPALQITGIEECAQTMYLDAGLVFGRHGTLVFVGDSPSHPAPTANGLKVGDTVTKVRSVYPNASPFGDDPNLGVPTGTGSQFDYWMNFDPHYENPNMTFKSTAPITSISLDDQEDCFD